MKPAGPFLHDIDTPALLVDLDMLEGNIAAMQSFFTGRKARLRPHFKTHKCLPIAHKQLAAGAKGITAAKVGEAEVLVAGGVGDVFVANQVVGSKKIRRLVSLVRHADISVAVDDLANVYELSKAVTAAGGTLGVYVELDIGMGRAGVSSAEEVVRLAKAVEESKGLEFRGLQGYEGHLVFAEDGKDKLERHQEALGRLAVAVTALEAAGLCCREVSGGGTGTYRLSGSSAVMTEIQAGSYVTMDARYGGVMQDFGQALFCLVTIISKGAAGLVIGDAGHKSITVEFGLPQVSGHEGLSVARLSEEHIFFEVSRDVCPPGTGGKVLLVPSHGCTTINLHDKLWGVRAGRLECVWQVAGRGRFD